MYIINRPRLFWNRGMMFQCYQVPVVWVVLLYTLRLSLIPKHGCLPKKLSDFVNVWNNLLAKVK
jgi:hypothetical protein